MRLHTRQYAHQASKHREHSTLQRPLSRHLTNPLDDNRQAIYTQIRQCKGSGVQWSGVLISRSQVALGVACDVAVVAR